MTSAPVIFPVLIPLLGAALSLLLRRHRSAQLLIAMVSLLTPLVTTGVLLTGLGEGRSAAVYQLGAWSAPFGITLVGDHLSLVFVLMSLFVLGFGLIYASGAKDKSVRMPAFVPLYLTLSASLCGGMLTGDTFNFFVFAELLVISAAALTALSDDKSGAEAAWKYFYISTFAGILLLGANGCLYAAYGTLNIADLTLRISGDPEATLLYPAAALLFCAMLVKGAVIPFHFWQPDFHTVSPTAVSAVLSSVVVKLGVYGLIRLTSTMLMPMRDTLLPMLMTLGILGIVAGGLAALGTHNAKRVLAYSTLAQVGFILAAIGLGTETALAAAVVFAVNHALVKSALLMLAGAMASRGPLKSASFDNLTGAGRASPAAGWLFLVGGLALIGMPPTNGFISKILVLTSFASQGRVLMVVLLAVASALTLLYVSRAYILLWWSPLPEGRKLKSAGDSLLAPACLVLTCVLLGLFPAPLNQLAARTAHHLQDPSAYVHPVLFPTPASPLSTFIPSPPPPSLPLPPVTASTVSVAEPGRGAQLASDPHSPLAKETP